MKCSADADEQKEVGWLGGALFCINSDVEKYLSEFSSYLHLATITIYIIYLTILRMPCLSLSIIREDILNYHLPR